MSVYAAPLLNELDPNGDMFQDRFFREHCLFHPELGVYAKDLCDVLKKRKTSINTKNDNELNGGDCEHACDERRIVLVDNNPLSFLPNPSNGILVSSFYDDPKDDTLEAVMELLNELEHVDDVRPILDERFGLKDALNDVIRETSWR
jgi:CTD small phosphatase-like protein 2